MNYFKYLVLAFIIAVPVNVFAGGDTQVLNTDTIDLSGIPVNTFNTQISAYYDLRDRNSYIQITNFSPNSIRIHVQIFQHDRGCDELNFFDDLTPNDTVVYDMDNIVKNNGLAAPINLADDSYGYVVVSDTRLDDGIIMNTYASLIGNFRIVDEAGYEYRTNMPEEGGNGTIFSNPGEYPSASNYIANFNTVDGANLADVVGYAYESIGDTSTVTNIDEGFSFDIFVFDMNEEPLSCDRRNFACGNVMNYGINEDYSASKGNNLLCPGGGLADPQGGYISFENGANLDFDGNSPDITDEDIFVNFVGINNGDGTGSMDIWINEEVEE
ncbi:MAG: hypothetical protein GTO02_03905 [Candidatus Dadabacteria bacterium]|nr:hypothetical protein [Candidatus Dadabacteria bacterium]NIQ13570.1 hypothetical protein [Candidatus Dadabacteria bacterium]